MVGLVIRRFNSFGGKLPAAVLNLGSVKTLEPTGVLRPFETKIEEMTIRLSHDGQDT
jgi:hypothetical protein